jgi:hypothetical protein
MGTEGYLLVPLYVEQRTVILTKNSKIATVSVMQFGMSKTFSEYFGKFLPMF